MNCETCAERRKQAEPVPFIVHEASMARIERTIKRLWILLMVMLVLLVGSNVAWIVYESQYETQYAEVEVDTGEGNAYVAGIGDVTYGEGESQN